MHRLHHHVTPAMYPPRRIVARFLRRSDRTRESDSARTLLLGRVTHRYVGWVITPLWLAAELLDYACHRATHIETTSSAHESILHNALALETALPVLSALWLRANPFSLLLMTGSSLLHTATGVYDIAYT